MKFNIESISSWVLAFLMVVFGLNKFLGFADVPPPTDPIAQQFMGAMFSSYLYVAVALAEIIGGLLIISSRLRFVGWLILAPVIFNIVGFHLFHDFIGNFLLLSGHYI